MDKRIQALDGLRAIAVSMVLLTHSWPYPKGHPILSAVLGSGWLGVDLFFVLSGFLITGILIKTRRTPDYFRAFYARRAIRIFPPYYALLAVVLFLLPCVTTVPAASMRDRWMYWLHLSNFALAGGWQFFPLDITWSLSIEEQFYLIWPTIIRWLDRIQPLCIGVIIAAPIARCVLWLMGVNWMWMHMMMPLRADAFAWGALLALQPARFARLAWVGVPIAVLAIAGLYGRSSELVNTLGYSLNSMAATGVIALALREDRFARLLEWKPAQYVGRVSYGVYLYHPLCVMAVYLAVPSWSSSITGGVIQVITVSMLAIALASASFYCFEKPIGRLKSRFESKDASAARAFPV